MFNWITHALKNGHRGKLKSKECKALMRYAASSLGRFRWGNLKIQVLPINDGGLIDYGNFEFATEDENTSNKRGGYKYSAD